MRNFRLVAVVSLALFAVCSQVHSAWAQVRRVPLLERPALNTHGLDRAWAHQVQMSVLQDRIETVSQVIAEVDGDKTMVLIVQSKRGVVEAIHGETGRTLWNVQVGSREKPTLQPAANRRFVAVINGATLYIYETATGILRSEMRLDRIPSGAPAVSDTQVFIPCWPNMIAAYEIVNREGINWTLASDGHLLAKPLVATGLVCWSSDAGSMYAAATDKPDLRFRLFTEREIRVSPVYITPYLIVASGDGMVFAVHAASGGRAWSFSASSPTSRTPAAIDGKLYLATDHGGMYCLDGQTGSVNWFTGNIDHLIAVTAGRVYTADTIGRTKVLDANGGALLDVVDSQYANQIQLVNQLTDRLYYATETGLIQCVHEAASTKPIWHPAPLPVMPSDAEDAANSADDEDAAADGDNAAADEE